MNNPSYTSEPSLTELLTGLVNNATALPLWACYGIVGGLFAVVGGVLLVLGKQKMARLHVVP
jgi:hypothetical protein